MVTGGNSGIGLETTRALATAGAEVIMTSRDTRRGLRAKESLETAIEARVEVMQLDLAQPSSIADFARRLRERFDHLDLLINNAGIMATPPSLTEAGIESQWATNHLGHFALTGLVLPLLIGGDARVVSVSSVAAAGGSLDRSIRTTLDDYQRFSVYSDTKLANQVFAVELNHRLASANSKAISVVAHPGVSHTNLVSGVGSRFATAPMKVLSRLFTQPAADGALPVLRAATDPAVEGGQYYGPSGRRQHRGPPKQIPLIPGAARRAVGRALWERSTELSGVRYLSGDA